MEKGEVMTEGKKKIEKKPDETGGAFYDFSIEEAFEKLNGIIGNLDKEEVPLEESFRLYEEGVKLLQYCNAKVDKVEKQIVVLNEMGNQDEF